MNIENRKLIIATVFFAIKGTFGIQEKLTITAFSLVSFDEEGYIIKSGWFELRSKSGTYYKVKVENYTTVTSLSKGNLNV